MKPSSKTHIPGFGENSWTNTSNTELAYRFRNERLQDRPTSVPARIYRNLPYQLVATFQGRTPTNVPDHTSTSCGS